MRVHFEPNASSFWTECKGHEWRSLTAELLRESARVERLDVIIDGDVAMVPFRMAVSRLHAKKKDLNAFHVRASQDPPP